MKLSRERIDMNMFMKNEEENIGNKGIWGGVEFLNGRKEIG